MNKRRAQASVTSSPSARIAGVVAAVGAIPRGATRSYGDVARTAGLGKAARFVANVLARSEQQLPWHRVVRADGRIAFAPDDPRHGEQIRRLRAEGIEVEQGRVGHRFRSAGDSRSLLDKALFGEP